MLRVQVPDEDLIERVVGRRMDPETGQIYHLTFKPPPQETLERLIQRADDTEEKAKARLEVHAGNVASVLDYYQDVLVEVWLVSLNAYSGPSTLMAFCGK